jgi:hypothetical protein
VSKAAVTYDIESASQFFLKVRRRWVKEVDVAGRS